MVRTSLYRWLHCPRSHSAKLLVSHRSLDRRSTLKRILHFHDFYFQKKLFLFKNASIEIDPKLKANLNFKINL